MVAAYIKVVGLDGQVTYKENPKAVNSMAMGMATKFGGQTTTTGLGMQGSPSRPTHTTTAIADKSPSKGLMTGSTFGTTGTTSYTSPTLNRPIGGALLPGSTTMTSNTGVRTNMAGTTMPQGTTSVVGADGVRRIVSQVGDNMARYQGTGTTTGSYVTQGGSGMTRNIVGGQTTTATAYNPLTSGMTSNMKVGGTTSYTTTSGGLPQSRV